MTLELLRELADVIETTKRLEVELHRAWLRHDELMAELRQSDKLKQYDQRARLEADLTSLCDEIEVGAQSVVQAAAAPASAMKSQPATDIAGEPSHARAILQLLHAAGGQASTAYLVEAMVSQRGTTRQAMNVLLRQMGNRGRLDRPQRGWYALPCVAKD